MENIAINIERLVVNIVGSDSTLLNQQNFWTPEREFFGECFPKDFLEKIFQNVWSSFD